MAQAPVQTSEQKLARALQPLLAEQSKTIMENMAAHITEVLLTLEKMQARIDVLERLAADRKKPAATKTRVAADGTAATGPAQPTGKPFPATKASYFKQKYKEGDEAWKAKYLVPEMIVAMNADATITERKGEAKITGEVSYCLNWLRSNNKALFDAVATDFSTEKAAHDDANKQAPLKAEEPKTP